jgi:signal transduction histidine kinase
MLVSVLLLTVVLAAGLAYEAWNAAHSHRVTAERTIREYAAFAAWEYNSSVKEALYSNIAWLFSPIVHEEPVHAGTPLKSPAVLLRHEAKQHLCQDDSTLYAFRLDVDSRTMHFVGKPPNAVQQAWIRDTILANLPSYKRDYSYQAITGHPSRGKAPHSIVYQVKWHAGGAPAAAYGVQFCVESFASGAFATIMRKYQILPPSLTGSRPNDSLFSVVVRDGAGKELFRSDTQYESMFLGKHVLTAYGGLLTSVAINPAIAGDLVIGGLPRSRLPLLLILLGLTGLLVSVGLTQLRRENELARLRSNFIASVSHELRTPLAQVRMFAETLRLGRVRNEGERERSLSIIDQEARRLTHLVENILQFSRAERNAVRLSPREADLAAEVRDTIDCFTPLARARRVLIETTLDPGIRASVDVEAFRQILLNVLDNAVKYGPEGQTVRVNLSRAGTHARITVEDEGQGIPAADRERIWAPFFRLERDASSAVAGSGIGLSVVRDLVELHGGRVTVEGRAQGTRFVIELPALPNAAERQPVRSVPVLAGSTDHRSNGQ